MRSYLPAPAVLLLSFLLTTPAYSQVLTGRIVDRISGDPVRSAFILVLAPDSSIQEVVRPDRSGNLVIRRPSPGPFLLRIERMGYPPVVTRAWNLSPTDSLIFEFEHPLEPLVLDSLTVTARLDPSGFYKRMKWGQGRFKGPEEIERIRPIFVADVLTGIPGFQMIRHQGGFRVAMNSRGRFCSPTVYLDGNLAAKGTTTEHGGAPPSRQTGVNLDRIVNVRRIRAVEVYKTPMDAPPGLHAVTLAGSGDCGVIALWTYLGFGQ